MIISQISSWEGRDLAFYGSHYNARNTYAIEPMYFEMMDLDFYVPKMDQWLKICDYAFPLTKIQDGKMVPFSVLGQHMFAHYETNFITGNKMANVLNELANHPKYHAFSSNQ